MSERDKIIEMEGIARKALASRRQRIAKAEAELGPMPPKLAQIMARENLADEVLIQKVYEATDGETLG